MQQDSLTLIRLFLSRAGTSPDRPCVRIFSRRQSPEKRSFGDVANDSGSIAALLAGAGVKKGDVVVLIGSHHINIYSAWLGAAWLGAVPCVLAEPGVRVDPAIYWSRLDKLAARISAKAIFTDEMFPVEQCPALQRAAHLRYGELLRRREFAPPVADVRPDDPLLLQHSSGTTGLQKGVMLSQAAVVRHAAAYQEAFPLSPDDAVVSWMPLYHDGGLIGCFTLPLIYGAELIALSPFEWVADPLMLLAAITEHRGTVLWLPNFAFHFLAKQAARKHGNWDLSTVRSVVNGSEPVTKAANDAFAGAFAAYGLRPNAIHTSYGMAENVLGVTRSRPERLPRVLEVDEVIWRKDGRAVESSGGTPLVSSGFSLPGVEIRIAGESEEPLPPNQMGRIHIKSPFMFGGYYQSPAAGLFDSDGFFDTGDLGFTDEYGELFVTGRAKDLIISAGKNIYPHEIEEVVNAISGVHPGRTVCFGVPMRGLDTETAVVMLECDWDEGRWPALAKSVKLAVAASADVELADVRIVKRGTLRKSTSGKISRDSNRSLYLSEDVTETSKL